jgi:4-amino-4-deoxy-L-arabinose transferase-like glycosyltransferase
MKRLSLHRRLLLGLLASALVIRVAAALVLPDAMSWPDGERYDRIARGLLAGAGYGRATDPPGHPLLLTLSYWLLGASVRRARVLWAIVGVIPLWATYQLAKTLFDKTVGLLSLAVTVVYPLSLYIAVLPEYPQALFTALLLPSVVLTVMQARQHASLQGAAALGLCGALGALTVPTMVLFLCAVGLWLLVQPFEPSRTRLRRCAIIAAVATLSILTWSTWHWRTTGYFFWIAANGGINVYKGNCQLMAKYGDPDIDDVLLAVGTPPGAEPAYDDHLETMSRAAEINDPRARDAFFLKQAAACIRESPFTAARLFGIKLVTFWLPYQQLVSDRVARRPPATIRNLILSFTYCPILALAITGAIVWRQEWRMLMPVYLALASQCLAYTLAHSAFRYRAPLDPLLIVMASAAVSELIRRHGSGHWKKAFTSRHGSARVATRPGSGLQ